MAWYLYGVTSGEGSGRFPDGLVGVDDAPVELLGDGDLRLVVSRFDRSLEELQSADPQETVRAVYRHDAVLTGLARQVGVLPIRFGTVLPDRSAAEDLLADPNGQLAATLRAVAGADEWVIAVAAREPEVADEPEHLTPGHAFFARRRSQAEARGDALRRAEALAAELTDELAGLARAARPLVPRESNTVARVAYLVVGRRRSLRAHRHRADGATVDVQGPLPPYRFVDAGRARPA